MEHFEFRTLRSSELDQWFDHLKTVFYPNPRYYYVKHYMEDPDADINGMSGLIHYDC